MEGFTMVPFLSKLITELLPATTTTSVTATLIVTLSLIFLFLKWSTRLSIGGKRRLAPTPAGSWPLIGHLNLLTGPELPHKTLAKVADEYGPIFRIKIGVHETLVISNWEMAKEVFGTHDRAFASRPQTMSIEILGYNSASLGLAPYGPYWREIRKIATVELLSNHRISQLKHVGISEVRRSVKELYNRWSADGDQNSKLMMVDMTKWFSDVSLNSILRLVAGVSLRDMPLEEERDRCHKAIKTWFDLMGAFTPSDALPYLRWLDLGGYEKTMKKAAEELDFFTQKWLDDHKRDRKSAGGLLKEKRDFMDVLLDVINNSETRDDVGDDQKKFFQYDTDTVIKATCLTMVLAATDTTTITLTWALSLLLNNPDILRKAQNEIDSHVGMKRLVDESDLKELFYLQAIIKETLRLYPATPLSFPRESIEDVIVSGYHVPAGTRLFFNQYKSQRDSQVWGDNSHEFFPERFLTSHKELDVRGQNFEIIPFGSGRRMCPGMSYALKSTSFILATILHGFDLSCPSDEPIDMKEGQGLTSTKVYPLTIYLKPRLSKENYENIA